MTSPLGWNRITVNKNRALCGVFQPEEINFSMKNAFITISNDDKRQMDNDNYVIFKEGNTHKLEKHSAVAVGRSYEVLDLSKHNTTQKYPNACKVYNCITY